MFRPDPRVRAVVLAAAVAASVMFTGCASSGAPPTGTTSTDPASEPATDTVDVPAACAALLQIDAVPYPGADPDAPVAPEALKQFGETVLVPLNTALAAADAELGESLAVLKPVVVAAAQEGTPIPDDGSVDAAIAGFHAWAHENCGYQKVDLMAVDYAFENVPASLKAGPVSFSMMNHSDKGEFHVALILRPKDPTVTTVEQLLEIPLPELENSVDFLGEAAVPPGATGGLLVDLEPGRYFVICPVPIGGDPASGDMHMLHGMANVLEVE